MDPSEPVQIFTDAELHDATGIDASARNAMSQLAGALLNAFRFYEVVQSEMERLLRDREAIKLGTLSPQEKAARGLVNPDGSANADVIARAIESIDAAIAFAFHEAQVITARPGFDRTMAGTQWERGETPTAQQLVSFFSLRDSWSTSDPFPQTLPEWGSALSLVSPTKATVLAEISRRTRERSARVRAKYGEQLSKLIELTGARIFAADRAHRSGRMTSVSVAALNTSLSGSMTLLGPKLIALSASPAAPATGAKRAVSFRMGEPYLLSASAPMFSALTGGKT